MRVYFAQQSLLNIPTGFEYLAQKGHAMGLVSEVSLAGKASLPVDGHVHLYDLSLACPILDTAESAFRSVPRRTGNLFGMLLLTQSANESVFESLKDLQSVGRWAITRATAEPETLLARSGESVIAIVCGRQVRTQDGLEVLALGTCEVFKDRMSLTDTIEAVDRTSAIPVIPWGFGKFMGARGERVAELLARRDGGGLFVGDNGSRLDMLGAPVWLREAERRGFRVLPGTDAFPLGRDYERIGSLGFMADIEPNEVSPWRSLRAWLLQLPVSPIPYGRACSLGRFVHNQVGIQLLNRFGRRSAR